MEVNKKSNQGLVIALVIMVFLLVGCLGYGVYKYLSLDKEYDKLNSENKSIKEQIEKQNTDLNKQDGTIGDDSNNTSVSHKDAYFDILSGNRTYINRNNKEVSISSFNFAEWQFSVLKDAKITEYTMLDMDSDGTDELIAVISLPEGEEFFLLLRYEDGEYYGFEGGRREIENLKENGYYYASCGADCGILLKSKFNKNVRTEETLAENDYGSYKINNKKVSKNEYDKFLDKFNNYKDVSWIKY